MLTNAVPLNSFQDRALVSRARVEGASSLKKARTASRHAGRYGSATSEYHAGVALRRVAAVRVAAAGVLGAVSFLMRSREN